MSLYNPTTFFIAQWLFNDMCNPLKCSSLLLNSHLSVLCSSGLIMKAMYNAVSIFRVPQVP